MGGVVLAQALLESGLFTLDRQSDGTFGRDGAAMSAHQPTLCLEVDEVAADRHFRDRQ